VIGCPWVTLGENKNEDEIEKDVTSKNKMGNKKKFHQVKELLDCIFT